VTVILAALVTYFSEDIEASGVRDSNLPVLKKDG
jgi:hypothetical protein